MNCILVQHLDRQSRLKRKKNDKGKKKIRTVKNKEIVILKKILTKGYKSFSSVKSNWLNAARSPNQCTHPRFEIRTVYNIYSRKLNKSNYIRSTNTLLPGDFQIYQSQKWITSDQVLVNSCGLFSQFRLRKNSPWSFRKLFTTEREFREDFLAPQRTDKRRRVTKRLSVCLTCT